MSKIYIFPGLGSTKKDFTHLSIGSYNFVEYENRDKHDTLDSFVSKIVSQIDEGSILIGFSFGGLLAIECAKKISAKKVILISSIESKKDIPSLIRFSGILLPFIRESYIHYIVNILSYTKIISREMKRLLYLRMSSISRSFVVRVVIQIRKRKNTKPVSNLFHIHGFDDKIFPLKKLHRIPDVMIPGSGHFLLNQNAQEVSTIIKKII